MSSNLAKILFLGRGIKEKRDLISLVSIGMSFCHSSVTCRIDKIQTQTEILQELLVILP